MNIAVIAGSLVAKAQVSYSGMTSLSTSWSKFDSYAYLSLSGAISSKECMSGSGPFLRELTRSGSGSSSQKNIPCSISVHRRMDL